MKILFLVLLSAFTINGIAYADSLKGGYGACVSEDLFDQFMGASVKSDKIAMKYLLKHGCIITKPGIHVSLLDVTWTGTAKVRAYAGNDAIVLWTNIENINRK